MVVQNLKYCHGLSKMKKAKYCELYKSENATGIYELEFLSHHLPFLEQEATCKTPKMEEPLHFDKFLSYQN